jgi:prepilin signal peptidase PulO-like enzyme (type II secretory pathway)
VLVIPALFSFILGSIVGSFLNVVGLRWNSGTTLAGRSFCFSCRKKLEWWELVPIVSFFILRGRCSSCRSKISWQYPLVEVLAGLVFLSIFNLQFSIFGKFSPAFFLSALLYAIVFSIYIVISIYDLRHKIIPDELAYAAIAVSIGILILKFILGFEIGALDLAAGPVLFLLFGAIWLFSRGRAMGFGDAKLALSIGILLGAAQGLSAAVLAFWIGTLAVFVWMLIARKRLTMKSEIPFGPFLVIGAWISLIFGLNLLYVSTF